MAGIGMQDPLSTEIQSPFLAGIVEGLNRISTGIDMKSVPIEKAEMTPVAGLDQADPRRIYQAADGNRLWLETPDPEIYVNDVAIDTLTSDYTIDFIGGSIAFNGSYRPGPSDSITFSCEHIYAAPQISGGYEILITFSSAFKGQEYTISGGESEYYSGIVPTDLEELVRVLYPNTEYTITSKTAGGETFSAKVSTGPYYGKYEVTLNTFSATITVSTVVGAEVTVSLGEEETYTQKVGSGGTATIRVSQPGEYTVKAYYQSAYSETKTVNVESNGTDYQTSVKFITLTVYIDNGSSVSVTDKVTTLQGVVDGESIVFYLPNTGTWEVYAALEGQDADYAVIVSEYKPYQVTLSYALNGASWERIGELSASGEFANYYDIGDTKETILNGEVQGYTFDNLKIDTFVIGINHNASVEGENLVHFMIGKIDGVDAALCDNNYNSAGSSDGFRMNKSDTNSGGWNASYMRTTVLGNGGTPASPASSSMMNALPQDLRAVIKPVTKWTDNHGGSSNSSSNVTSTTDYLFVPAEFEVQGSRSYANQYEQNHQLQYSYFSSGNSKIAYKHTSPSTAVLWWCRSPHPNHSYTFVIVDTSGSSNYTNAPYSFGLRPCFCV